MYTKEQQAAKDVYVPRYYNPYATTRPSLSRERIRQIETIALRKFKRALILRGIHKDHLLG